MKTKNNNNFLIYTGENGNTQVEVKFENENVWLSQKQMGLLYGKGRTTIIGHIKNIFEDGELEEKVVCQEYRHTTNHGALKEKTQIATTNLYNLEMILSIGYRVRSKEGVQFRKWATAKLKEYMIKGFVLDDERLKQGGEKARFLQELLQRIRDIRSSERNFYQKVTDIYATSIDYKTDAKATKNFFASVQNKMHFAVTGKTAAEIIEDRANFQKENMGLTNFKGKYITLKDTQIAKNYLTEKELNELNLIVSMYLDFAELQALNGRLMKMQDWIEKLDFFLTGTEKKILQGLGNTTNKTAIEKAKIEFDKFKSEEDLKYVSDFDIEVKKITKEIKKA